MGRAAIAEILDHDDELVTTQAGRGVGGTNRGDQTPSHLHEHRIAGGVAELVVDLLEPVEVDEQHGDRLCRSGPAPEGVPQAVEQRGTVGQAGERVGQRPAGDLALALLSLDRVADGSRELGAVGLALDQVVLRTHMNGVHGQRLVLVAAQHDDRHAGGERLRLGDRIETFAVRQREVEQDAVRRLLPEHRGGRREGAHAGHHELGAGLLIGGLVGQHLLHEPRVLGRILDQQDRERRAGLARTGAEARSRSRCGVVLSLVVDHPDLLRVRARLGRDSAGAGVSRWRDARWRPGPLDVTRLPPPSSACDRRRADDGARTRDPELGKLVLYQLSYVRERLSLEPARRTRRSDRRRAAWPHRGRRRRGRAALPARSARRGPRRRLRSTR